MLPLLVANLKIMVRDRQALMWALAFPLILVTVFGIFDIDATGSADLAIIGHADIGFAGKLSEKLADIDYLNFDTRYSDPVEARKALEDGELEYLLVVPANVGDVFETSKSIRGSNAAVDSEQLDGPVALTLYYDVDNTLNSELVFETISNFVNEENLSLMKTPLLLGLSTEGVEARKVEYFDVLLIGLVAMGMMTNSIIFIAVKISLYRNQSILKRILVTPLRVRNYFAAEILAHLVLTLVQAAVVIGVGVYVFGGRIHGNILWLFIIVAFANTIFLNIGFIISAWANSPRAASGMGNAVAIPMLFFSGTFFPTSSLPSILPDLVQVLPLTPMLGAMRGVAIDGLALWDVWLDMAMLAGWLVVSSVAATKLFRFG